MLMPHDFYLSVINKRFDLDGSYGAQCWDGFAQYCKWLGVPIFHCTQTGYVRDIWNLRKTSGILNYFTEITNPDKMQDGDVAIFERTDSGNLPHIGIFRKWENGKMILLGENQGGSGGAFNQKYLSKTGFLGALRPNRYKNGFDTEYKKVKFKSGLRVEKYDAARDLVYNSVIGGWISPSICQEDSAKDGAKDQYFANTNATFTIPGTYTVEKETSTDILIKEFGFWVKKGAVNPA